MRSGIRTSFSLQATLILLPVVILAVVGLVMVQRDKESVIQEARESSERIAPAVADHLGRLLIDRMQDDLRWILQSDQEARTRRASGNTTVSADYFGEPFKIPGDPFKALTDTQPASGGGYVFDGSFGWILVVDRDGQSIAPPTYPAIPVPRHPAEPLSTEEFAVWEAKLETAFAAMEESTDFAVELDHVLASGEAQFIRVHAEALATEGDTTKSLALYRWLASRTERLTTQSGLPLQVVSALAALQLIDSGSIPWDAVAMERMRKLISEQLEVNVILYPSCISGTVLKQLHSDKPGELKRRLAAWDTLNSTLDFTQVLAKSLGGTRLSRENLNPRWLRWQNLDWWVGFTPPMEDATESSVEEVFAIYPFSRHSLELGALELIQASGVVLPPGVGVRVEVDGVPVVDPSPGAPLLAGHSSDIVAGGYHRYKNFDQYFEECGIGRVAVSLVIAEPNILLAMQRQRSLWLFGIIGGALLVSLVGLAMLRVTHNRQLALNAMKTNFVSSVSHELRAPIASVRLMAENLQSGKVTGQEKTHEYIGFIGQECRRLSSLIENVLDYSRIEQGRMSYQLEPTDLVQLVNDTVRLMQPYADERKVALKLEIDAQPNGTERRHSCRPESSSPTNAADGTSAIEVTVDARAIQQALINLIDNAVKHSPEGESVIVRASSATAVRISVEDHGPGVPVEERHKVFERFYRRGSELRRETQGIGIGLSIVQHIVEGHNGKVWVESEPGKGSKFVVTLNGSTNRE